jgi:Leucine-rich repeat (LRR) protein
MNLLICSNIFRIFLFLILFYNKVEPKFINCRPEWIRYEGGQVFKCSVISLLGITSKSDRNITDVENLHEDFKGLSFYGNRFNFFPQNMETFFKNIEDIVVSDSGLLEIEQADLMQFKKLKILNLQINDIIRLEAGLFDFNPDLESFTINYNKITFIQPNIFDHLTKLHTLNFYGNKCTKASAMGDKLGVRRVIKKLEKDCPTFTNKYFDEIVIGAILLSASFGFAVGYYLVWKFRCAKNEQVISNFSNVDAN